MQKMSVVTLKSLSTPHALRIGAALLPGPLRFTDLNEVVRHSQDLARTLRRLIAVKLVEKNNFGAYRITARGRCWAQAGEPLIDWLAEHRDLTDDAPAPVTKVAERLRCW
jgi:DNA-binding HxlR family transcriptional regulator